MAGLFRQSVFDRLAGYEESFGGASGWYANAGCSTAICQFPSHGRLTSAHWVRRDAGLNHCLPATARRKRRQFCKDCHGLALKRRASVEVARQSRREGFRPVEGGVCICHGCRLLRPLAPPVPCRAADACRQPRALCRASWPSSMRSAPALRAQAGFLASFRVYHRWTLMSWQFGHCTAPRNDLIRAIIEDFATRLVPGGILIYAGDTGEKWGHFDAPLLAGLGVNVESWQNAGRGPG
jgi:hypothetical protein